MSRLGILGGTFDPIHIGHLVMASYAIDALELDNVWFMPAQTPPHKHHEITPVEHRAEMVRRAVQLDSRFDFSDLDLRGQMPSFTSELLSDVHASVPNRELIFLMGADSLTTFATWHEPETILRHAALGVAERPGSTIDNRIRNSVPGLAERILEFDSPLIELSSSEIRLRRQQRKSITYLVPEVVEDYIIERGLYRLGKTAPR